MEQRTWVPTSIVDRLNGHSSVHFLHIKVHKRVSAKMGCDDGNDNYRNTIWGANGAGSVCFDAFLSLG